jgi:DNA invertase Pin-like site-specific DNA recombinase
VERFDRVYGARPKDVTVAKRLHSEYACARFLRDRDDIMNEGSKVRIHSIDGHGFCGPLCDTLASATTRGPGSSSSRAIAEVSFSFSLQRSRRLARPGDIRRAVLVYDVSRWGRFQDADESAYYEYGLKKAGVHVHYCAEHFQNDGSLSSVLLKALKRTMAGEYSRELSIKVLAGQRRQVELGFHQGGHAGYGLRRQLVDLDGNAKGLLLLGQWKSLHSDKVILVPGPQLELDVVAWIYRSFIDDGMTETEIRNDLNARGIKTAYNKTWMVYDVHRCCRAQSMRASISSIVNPSDLDKREYVTHQRRGSAVPMLSRP